MNNGKSKQNDENGAHRLEPRTPQNRLVRLFGKLGEFGACGPWRRPCVNRKGDDEHHDSRNPAESTQDAERPLRLSAVSHVFLISLRRSSVLSLKYANK